MPQPLSDRVQRLDQLRAEVRAIVSGGRREDRPVLPFGLAEIDDRLADGGLAAGALHEIAGASAGMGDDAAATLFTAGIAARAGPRGVVLWVLSRRDLFAPGLAQAGLGPDRLLQAEARREEEVLAVMEEGLRHKGLAAVVGEVAKGVSLAATRRLQLAAEDGGVMALMLRRPRNAERGALAEPSAAVTRWQVSTRPSTPLEVGPEGIGRARWRVELVRQKGGEGAVWDVEGCDAQGRLAVPAGLRDRSPAAVGSEPGSDADAGTAAVVAA